MGDSRQTIRMAFCLAGRGGLAVRAAFLACWIAAAPVFAADSPASNDSRHWAFRPLKAVSSDETLDRLIQSRLEPRSLQLAGEADRRTLCRRLYLDLIGLPPSPAQVERFVRDDSPEAVETLVDGLLASPHFGERWGRQWLDVVGYADSNGYIRHDSPRPLAYRYRDYVIQSLNDDKPYDQFWREQLAGDELVHYADAATLSDADKETLIATHYLRNPPDGTDNTEGNEITRVMERYAVLEALVQTTMSSMFGMTIDCARCHDHKFDPIPQKDYYALQAIFYPAFNVKEWVQPKNRWIHAASPAEIAAWKASHENADRRVAELRREHQNWVVTHRPPGDVQWSDDFSATSLKDAWSPTAPDDVLPANTPLTQLDAEAAPAAKIIDGKLSLFAAGSGDSRWLATQRLFDWTPNAVGEWVQVTFDLTASGANGQPAERVGYYIALHDHNDDSPVAGGNILFDGNPAGGAGVVLDYPGGDQQGLGAIGVTGYLPGRNFGVRITRTGEDEFRLEHLVAGEPEAKSLTLTAVQLPDGAFGFELCCGRNFTVDNVVVESSAKSPGNDERQRLREEFAKELTQRQEMLTAAIAAVEAQRLPEPEKIAWATDLSPKLPDVPLLHRGDYFQPGDFVLPAPLSVLVDDDAPYHPLAGSQTTGRRLAFANWATKPDSRAAALLARVQVDRIWRGHFGKGLVPTPENFGSSGVEPANPELLEWLAGQLVANGWRQKPIHRLIVLSQTYRQTSEPSAAALERDPTNEFYSRFPSHRLAAEQIRDSMLAVAGVLNPQRGGPAVEPVDHGDRKVVLTTPTGDGPHAVDRRSIYIRYRRSQPLTFLRAFDQASPDPNCVARGNSTVVAQSLALLNGEFSLRMGEEFAKHLQQDAPDANAETLIRLAFQRAYLRDPSADELKKCAEYLHAQAERRDAALADLCRLLLASNEFLYLP